MKGAIEKAKAVINQLTRQRDKWLKETGNDQTDLAKLLRAREELTQTYQEEYARLTEQAAAKFAEIQEENQPEILRYNQLIKEAEASLQKLIS